jgi:hypothetical protein
MKVVKGRARVIERADVGKFAEHQRAQVRLDQAHAEFVQALAKRDAAKLDHAVAHAALIAHHGLVAGDRIDEHGIIHRTGGK